MYHVLSVCDLVVACKEAVKRRICGDKSNLGQKQTKAFGPIVQGNKKQI